MQDDANFPKETDTTKSTISLPEKSVCLFTQEEATSIAKDFINAWMRGEVEFDFPCVQELAERARIMGKKIDYEQADKTERKEKEGLRELIIICSDNTTSTLEQRQKAMQDIFRHIINLRLGHRLKGKFTELKLEDKIKKLEENIGELNKHFEELYFYVKTKIPDDSILGKR